MCHEDLHTFSFQLIEGMDSVEIATARFLAEQEERTRELEEKLNAHIEGLKSDTNSALHKYSL